MAVIRNLVVKIAADISSLSKGLQTAEKQIKKVASAFTAAGTKLTASVTAPLVALGYASVNISQQFEQSMANAASVSGATGDELERMKEIAREMGAQTVFSASDAADAMYYMASAGYKVDQMADSIRATLDLAAATQSDLAFTSDVVISTLNQFGMEASEASRVTNTFAAVIGASQATMEKLAYSMRYVGPIANSLGYSVEEAAGALGILYNAGFQGEQAGTVLRSALSRLLKPTAEMIGAFEELGLSVDDMNPSMNSLEDIIRKLEDAGIDSTQAVKIFGVEAGPGMLAMISSGADALHDMTEQITGTSAATEMAEKQLDTLQGQMKILKSEVEEIALQFGDILIPIIRQLLQKYITPLTNKLMNLSAGTKKNIVVIALLAAAIEPLLLVVGKLISSVGVIVKIGSLLFSKVGLIIAAILIAVVVLKRLWDTNEDFRNAVMEIWEKIKTFILDAVNAIKDWWEKNGEKVINKVVSTMKALWKVLKQVFGKIQKIAEKVWGVVKDIVIDAVTAIQAFWTKNGETIWATVKTLFTNIWNIVSTAFDIIYNAVVSFLGYVRPIWENIKQLFASLWDTMVALYETLKPVFDLLGGIIMTLYGVVTSVVSGIISALGPFVQAVIDVAQAILEVIQLVCAVLRGDWSEAWEHMKNVASNLWDAIKNIFLGIWEFIQGFCEGIKNFFSKLGDNIAAIFKSAWEGISGFFVNVWEGIKSVCSWIWDTITGLFSKIGDFFSGLFKDAFNWGKNLIQNIGDGIKKAWDWVVDGVKGVGESIADFLGFGSPTKKGPGHTADEWIPNLMDMMAQGMYDDIPLIQRAAIQVANALGLTTTANRAMVGAGTSPNGDLLNGLLQGIASMNGMRGDQSGNELVLQIDGQTFARLIVPSITREYKRNGIELKGV